MATLNITEKISRSLTLLRVFILASALLLAVAAASLAVIMTNAVRKQAIEDAQASLTEYTNGVLHREVVRLDHQGRSVFNDLRYRCTLVSFVAFVLLRIDRQDVRDLPVLERNRRLAASASDHTICTTCPTLSVAGPICC